MNLPQGTAARLSIIPGARVYQLTLTPPEGTSPPVGNGRGAVMTLLIFAAGSTWPDRAGRLLVEATLEESVGGVVFEFATLADALGCQARLRRCGVA